MKQIAVCSWCDQRMIWDRDPRDSTLGVNDAGVHTADFVHFEHVACHADRLWARRVWFGVVLVIPGGGAVAVLWRVMFGWWPWRKAWSGNRHAKTP